MAERDFKFDKDDWLCPKCGFQAHKHFCGNCGFKIYAGFKHRFAALFVDSNILQFWFLFYMLMLEAIKSNESNKILAFVLLSILNIFIIFFYNIYFVGKWGQTLGKMYLRIKVVCLDGSCIEWKNAWFRYSVDLIFVFAFTVLNFYKVSHDDEIRSALAFFDGPNPSFSKMPLFVFYFVGVQLIWFFYVWSEVFVLLTNKKRRAIHDFIAGTVVIHDPRLSRTPWKLKET